MSNKAPRLSFDDRTSSASSLGSTSSGRSSLLSTASSSTIYSASPGSYETDATSPPLSQSSLSYSSLPLPIAHSAMYPPIPLAHHPHEHRHRPPPPPAPPVSYSSDPAVSTLATTMSHNLDFGLGAYQQHQPQGLAARRRGLQLAIPLPQPPPFDSGFVPASAPPTVGHFVTSQEAYDRSQQQQSHYQPYQPQSLPPLPPPPPPKHGSPFPQYESGAVDDWSLPTPVSSGGTNYWRGFDSLPTPLREFGEFNSSGGAQQPVPPQQQQQQQHQQQGYTDQSLGLSPWSAPNGWSGV